MKVNIHDNQFVQSNTGAAFQADATDAVVAGAGGSAGFADDSSTGGAGGGASAGISPEAFLCS